MSFYSILIEHRKLNENILSLSLHHRKGNHFQQESSAAVGLVDIWSQHNGQLIIINLNTNLVGPNWASMKYSIPSKKCISFSKTRILWWTRAAWLHFVNRWKIFTSKTNFSDSCIQPHLLRKSVMPFWSTVFLMLMVSLIKTFEKSHFWSHPSATQKPTSDVILSTLNVDFMLKMSMQKQFNQHELKLTIVSQFVVCKWS